MFVCNFSFPDMVSLLLEFNANVHHTSEDGVSALSYAAKQGHIEIIRLLLAKKAKVCTF